MCSDKTTSIVRLSDIFSPEELISLNKVVNRHLAALSFIRENCTREQAGQQIVYALDFQELYAYAHPYDKAAQHPVMATYILNESKRPILLLPGTLKELLDYLEETSRRLAKIKSLSAILKYESSVTSLLQRIHNMSLSDKDVGQYFDELVLADTRNLSLSLLSRMVTYERELDRLHWILSRENVKGLGELVDVHGISAAEKVACFDKCQRAYRLLEVERPDRTPNNIADAANVALTFLLRNYRGTSGGLNPYCAYLVTHTPTLMLINFRTWGKDAVGQRYGLESGILAHPEDVLYATIVEAKFGTWETRMAFANCATSTCSGIQQHLPPLLPTRTRRRSRNEAAYLDDLLHLQRIKAQALEQYLADFYDYLDRELLAPLHEYEQHWFRDLQFETNKRLAFGDTDSATSQAMVVSTDRIKSKISAIQQICRKKLIDDALGLDAAVVTRDEQSKVFTPGLFSLEEHEERIEELNCSRYQLYQSTRPELVLGIDEYPQYYCCFWRTSEPFARLSASLNALWQRMRQRGIQQIQQAGDEDATRRDVYVQGVLAFTLKRRHERKLAIPLDFGKLAAQLADEGLQSVRVNTMIGDFFADVLPEQVGGDTYVGVVSHVNLQEYIVDLFYDTSCFYVWPTTLKSVLSTRLSKYEALGGK